LRDALKARLSEYIFEQSAYSTSELLPQNKKIPEKSAQKSGHLVLIRPHAECVKLIIGRYVNDRVTKNFGLVINLKTAKRWAFQFHRQYSPLQTRD